MDTGSRIKLVREHRGLTQQKLGEMLGYGKSSANRIAQYEMGYRSPKANRLKEIAKAMNIREEIFLMPDETPIDLLRILIWYDWEHEGVLQLATSRTANTPPGKTVSPIIYSESFNRFLIISLDVLICRYSPLFRAFPALFISEEPHKSFYYPSCFHSQK